MNFKNIIKLLGVTAVVFGMFIFGKRVFTGNEKTENQETEPDYESKSEIKIKIDEEKECDSSDIDLDEIKRNTSNTIKERHGAAGEILKDSFSEMKTVSVENEKNMEEIENLLYNLNE